MSLKSRAGWIGPLAVSLACLFIAPYVTVFPHAVTVLILISAFAATLAAVVAFRGRIALRRDKYDLRTLLEVHENSQMRELEPGTVAADADRIVCPMCGRDYNARLPVCPGCRHCP